MSKRTARRRFNKWLLRKLGVKGRDPAGEIVLTRRARARERRRTKQGK